MTLDLLAAEHQLARSRRNSQDSLGHLGASPISSLDFPVNSQELLPQLGDFDISALLRASESALADQQTQVQQDVAVPAAGTDADADDQDDLRTAPGPVTSGAVRPPPAQQPSESLPLPYPAVTSGRSPAPMAMGSSLPQRPGAFVGMRDGGASPRLVEQMPLSSSMVPLSELSGGTTSSEAAGASSHGTSTGTEPSGAAGAGHEHPGAAGESKPMRAPAPPQPRDAKKEAAAKRKAAEVDLATIHDPQERKKQRRLAKNRATAALSRERKKKQMATLQERVNELEAQVAALAATVERRDAEVAALRQQLGNGSGSTPALGPAPTGSLPATQMQNSSAGDDQEEAGGSLAVNRPARSTRGHKQPRLFYHVANPPRPDFCAADSGGSAPEQAGSAAAAAEAILSGREPPLLMRSAHGHLFAAQPADSAAWLLSQPPPRAASGQQLSVTEQMSTGPLGTTSASQSFSCSSLAEGSQSWNHSFAGSHSQSLSQSRTSSLQRPQTSQGTAARGVPEPRTGQVFGPEALQADAQPAPQQQQPPLLLPACSAPAGSALPDKAQQEQLLMPPPKAARRAARTPRQGRSAGAAAAAAALEGPEQRPRAQGSSGGDGGAAASLGKLDVLTQAQEALSARSTSPELMLQQMREEYRRQCEADSGSGAASSSQRSGSGACPSHLMLAPAQQQPTPEPSSRARSLSLAVCEQRQQAFSPQPVPQQGFAMQLAGGWAAATLQAPQGPGAGLELSQSVAAFAARQQHPLLGAPAGLQDAWQHEQRRFHSVACTPMGSIYTATGLLSVPATTQPAALLPRLPSPALDSAEGPAPMQLDKPAEGAAAQHRSMSPASAAWLTDQTLLAELLGEGD